MSLSVLLEMSAASDPDRIAVVDGEHRLTRAQLSALADGGAAVIADAGVGHVCYVGTGGADLPVALFSAARAATPFTPLNYRLSSEALRELICRLPHPLVVADDAYLDAVADCGVRSMTAQQFRDASAGARPVARAADPDEVAVVLFTSGTTSRPKAVELTHNNLTSYVTGTVEFDAANPDDAALICVPPYHIAGVGASLSNLYAGRRMVFLRTFSAAGWVDLARSEAVRTATVVPTMLARIVTELQHRPTSLPALQSLAYGGSKVPLPLVRSAFALLPDVDFVNAYGLTETSSTIAVLTPQDHRDAIAANDAAIARRLGSVGRPLPGVEVQIRDDTGAVLGPNATGELYVRGEQVSGRYTDAGSVLDTHGWFPTRDIAIIDEAGYLYLGGRSDDTIIRGGENIAPAELEDVLIEHPCVGEVAVVGVEDAQWGQIIVAVVVPAAGAAPDAEQLRAYVREQLRGSRTPDKVLFIDELPTSHTGKLLRRQLADEITAGTYKTVAAQRNSLTTGVRS